VDAVHTYKPHPRVYLLGGARAFGYRVVWVDRAGALQPNAWDFHLTRRSLIGLRSHCSWTTARPKLGPPNRTDLGV
jgi:hypothetical protein